MLPCVGDCAYSVKCFGIGRTGRSDGQIQSEVNTQAKTFGIEIIDVRIAGTDLPPQTWQAVFQRMRTEREREARELRAEGAETAQDSRWCR